MFAALIPLIGLLAPLIPSIGRLIGGSGGEAVAEKIGGVVTAVAGGTDPAQVAAALADPSKASEMLVRLQEIEASAEKARSDAVLSDLVARLGDVQSARSQTVDLARISSPLAYGAVIMTIFVMTVVLTMTWMLLTQAYPDGSKDIVLLLVGQVLGWGSAAVAYWLGSSAGSQQKTNLLAASPSPLSHPAGAIR